MSSCSPGHRGLVEASPRARRPASLRAVGHSGVRGRGRSLKKLRWSGWRENMVLAQPPGHRGRLTVYASSSPIPFAPPYVTLGGPGGSLGPQHHARYLVLCVMAAPKDCLFLRGLCALVAWEGAHLPSPHASSGQGIEPDLWDLPFPGVRGELSAPPRPGQGAPAPWGLSEPVGIKAQTCQAQGAAEGPEDLSVALSCPISPCWVALGKSLHLSEPINEYPDATDPYGQMVEVGGSSSRCSV